MNIPISELELIIQKTQNIKEKIDALNELSWLKRRMILKNRSN